MAKTKARPVEGLSYEQAFEELEELVERLESGDLPLEDSLGLFERGQALAEHCGRLLEHAELRLRQLLPEGGDGEIDLEVDLPED